MDWKHHRALKTEVMISRNYDCNAFKLKNYYLTMYNPVIANLDVMHLYKAKNEAAAINFYKGMHNYVRRNILPSVRLCTQINLITVEEKYTKGIRERVIRGPSTREMLDRAVYINDNVDILEFIDTEHVIVLIKGIKYEVIYHCHKRFRIGGAYAVCTNDRKIRLAIKPIGIEDPDLIYKAVTDIDDYLLCILHSDYTIDIVTDPTTQK